MDNFTRLRVYKGRFTKEEFLFELPNEANIMPQKNDLLFYGEEMYKVLYCLLDYDNDEYSVFVRAATEEDY